MSRYQIPELGAPPLYRYGLPATDAGVTPAAGADFQFAQDGQYYTRLIVVVCRLVTSATVANREVVLEVRDADNQRIAIHGAPVLVTAATTVDYCFSSFLEKPDWPANSTILVPLTPLLLTPAWTWRLQVVNVQAADQLSRIRITRDRFLTGAPE